MVSPLRRYSKDPMRKGRGPGLYYRRSYKGNKHWYSKYSPDRDAQIKARRKYDGREYRHSGDMTKRGV